MARTAADEEVKGATMEGARGTKTKLRLGVIPPVDIQLYGTIAKGADPVEFERAGPNGGALRVEQRGKPTDDAPAAERVPVLHDEQKPAPVVEDPGAEAPPPEEWTAATGREVERHEEAQATSEPGEYRAVLVEEGSGEEVEPEDVRRGVRLASGKFVDLTGHLADIDERTKLDAMEVIYTLDVGQVQRSRIKGSHYVAPANKGAFELLRLIYEGMREARLACVVKLTKKTRQTMGVLTADGKTGAVVLLELAYAEDFRVPEAKQLGHQQAQVTRSKVDATVELLRALRDSRSVLDEVRDDAVALREELHEAAVSGKVKAFKVVQPPAAADEPDIEALLAESIERAAEVKAAA